MNMKFSGEVVKYFQLFNISWYLVINNTNYTKHSDIIQEVYNKFKHNYSSILHIYLILLSLVL